MSRLPISVDRNISSFQTHDWRPYFGAAWVLARSSSIPPRARCTIGQNGGLGLLDLPHLCADVSGVDEVGSNPRGAEGRWPGMAPDAEYA